MILVILVILVISCQWFYDFRFLHCFVYQILAIQWFQYLVNLLVNKVTWFYYKTCHYLLCRAYAWAKSLGFFWAWKVKARACLSLFPSLVLYDFNDSWFLLWNIVFDTFESSFPIGWQTPPTSFYYYIANCNIPHSSCGLMVCLYCLDLPFDLMSRKLVARTLSFWCAILNKRHRFQARLI